MTIQKALKLASERPGERGASERWPRRKRATGAERASGRCELLETGAGTREPPTAVGGRKRRTPAADVLTNLMDLLVMLEPPGTRSGATQPTTMPGRTVHAPAPTGRGMLATQSTTRVDLIATPHVV